MSLTKLQEQFLKGCPHLRYQFQGQEPPLPPSGLTRKHSRNSLKAIIFTFYYRKKIQVKISQKRKYIGNIWRGPNVELSVILSPWHCGWHYCFQATVCDNTQDVVNQGNSPKPLVFRVFIWTQLQTAHILTFSLQPLLSIILMLLVSISSQDWNC